MNENPHQTEAASPSRPFLIADWRVEPDTGRLTRDDQSIKLEPKVMELLVYLAQRPGRVLSREELEGAIWAGTVVGYDALTNAIIKLRKALGDGSRKPRFIETVPKKGYRLIAPVVGPDDASSSSVPEPAIWRWHFSRAVIWASVVLAGVAIGWLAFDYFGSRMARIPSIAVLSFANLGDDPKLAYFSDGVREDIITDLSKLSGLRVMAHNPASSSLDKPPTHKGAADTLGTRYVLEGSVRRSGDDIRITAKLIDTRTGSHLWAEGYNRRMRDLFVVQDDITRNIVAALTLTLTEEEKEYVARRDTRSVEAYDLFLQGQARYARNLREENLAARDYFSRALARDGNFTRAHGALALTHTDDLRNGWSHDPSASADAALRHAERAVALDARSAQAHWILGYVHLFVRKDLSAALKMGERAVTLDPNSANAHGFLGMSSVYLGDTRTAIRHAERALLLDPENPARYRTVLGLAHYFAGRYDQALAALEQTLEQDPERLLPQLYLAATLSQMGRQDDARWLADIVRTKHPDYKLQVWVDSQPFANLPQRRKIVDDLRRAGLS